MKILMTGATGFIGKQLGKNLTRSGHDIVVLTRNPASAKAALPFPCEVYEWDPETTNIPPAALQDIEGLIHLAGEPIAAKRWSPPQKKKIEKSRTIGTKNLITALAKQTSLKSAVFASAIGYYGNRDDEALDEKSSRGKGFLSDVCVEWEKTVQDNPLPQTRICTVRIGLVLGKDGGMMEKVLLPFSMGVGGPLGSGKQWMSWIHLDDLVGIFQHLLENTACQGVYNGTAPNPVTNAEFTKVLGQTLQKPAFLPAPAPALKLALGEMSDLLLASQKISSRIAESGYAFKFTTLEAALKEVCPAPGEEEFVQEQFIPENVEKVFTFFSDANNLQTITPPWLHFKILNLSTPTIQKGTLLDYQLEIHGIPVKWQTLIETWNPSKDFSDSQSKGPYQKWHHTHSFEPLKNGTLMKDVVAYKVPGGLFGKLLNIALIKRDLKDIFQFRKKKVEEILH